MVQDGNSGRKSTPGGGFSKEDLIDGTGGQFSSRAGFSDRSGVFRVFFRVS